MPIWLNWIGTAFCWLTAPLVAYTAIGSVMLLLHPFVEQKVWALMWLAVAGLWCVVVQAVMAGHRGSAAWTHFWGCNVGLLAGLAWLSIEITSQ